MQRYHRRRGAFTLIELLVALAVIGVLAGLLFPAVQAIREVARRTECLSNVRQITLAAQGYEAAFRHYPTSFEIVPGTVLVGNNGSWSIHGRLLPFIEQASAYNFVDLDIAWDAQIATGVPTLRVPIYLCPSEINDTVRINPATGEPRIYPQNYGFNFGTWLVYDPVAGKPGTGPFYVNSRVRGKDVRDGLTSTLCIAEVKTFTPYIRNTTVDPGSVPPTDPAAFMGYAGDRKMGPDLQDNTGHTEWCDGRVHHSGFTTVFPPNTKVPYVFNGEAYDIDFNSMQEGRSATRSTYAAITARSYHSGGLVNVSMLDGSTRSIFDGINLQLWRDLSAIADGKIIDASAFE
jgi:prepilin-type N-terminal cleavage/methylation domain-containing protein/prepilin-type processing-associated H-X9-DG protein